jgi:glyoxylase-like metal-dependent hydrolase (beta-lactamase superfamily II)
LAYDVKAVKPPLPKSSGDVRIAVVIPESLTVGPFASNCYILGSEHGREGIIIDPGDSSSEILRRVKSLELKIKYIVLTHGHVDHTGALSSVRDATAARIALHSADVRLLGDRAMGIMLGLDYPAPPQPDMLLSDEDEIQAGDIRLSVIHTPGHTPGSICLLGDEVVFTGDTLFNYGIGRSDLPGGNGEELLKSIQSRLLVLSDETKVYPGHGPPTTIGEERRGNPFLT